MSKPGELPEHIGYLFVQNQSEPMAQMKATKKLLPYDNKIIECTFKVSLLLGIGEFHIYCKLASDIFNYLPHKLIFRSIYFLKMAHDCKTVASLLW